MHHLEERYCQNPSIVSRQVAGEFILVPIRQNVGDLDCIYTLNETAACAWACFDGQHTLAQIRDRIVAEFEVEPQQAYQDLLELVDQLLEIHALQKV